MIQYRLSFPTTSHGLRRTSSYRTDLWTFEVIVDLLCPDVHTSTQHRQNGHAALRDPHDRRQTAVTWWRPRHFSLCAELNPIFERRPVSLENATQAQKYTSAKEHNIAASNVGRSYRSYCTVKEQKGVLNVVSAHYHLSKVSTRPGYSVLTEVESMPKPQ